MISELKILYQIIICQINSSNIDVLVCVSSFLWMMMPFWDLSFSRTPALVRICGSGTLELVSVDRNSNVPTVTDSGIILFISPLSVQPHWTSSHVSFTIVSFMKLSLLTEELRLSLWRKRDTKYQEHQDAVNLPNNDIAKGISSITYTFHLGQKFEWIIVWKHSLFGDAKIFTRAKLTKNFELRWTEIYEHVLAQNGGYWVYNPIRYFCDAQ